MNHSVAAVIFNEDRSRVLCVKRRDVSIWVIPGGIVDDGETLEGAVAREVKEETGLTVEVKRKIGEYTPIQVINTITHVFECTPVSGSLTCTDEVRDAGYYSISELPQLFFLLHETWIHEALENKEMISRELHELTYWSLFKYTLRHPIHVFRFFLSKVLGMPINS